MEYMELRKILYLLAMLFYTAAILNTLIAFFRAWKARIPLRGPASASYLNVWSFFFLGAGFLSGAIYSEDIWMRLLYGLAALFQFFVCVFNLRRFAARYPQAPRNPPTGTP